MEIMTNTVINVHVHVHSDNKKMKHHGFPAAETLMLQTWCQGINTLHFLLLLNTRLRPAKSPVHCESGSDRGPLSVDAFPSICPWRFSYGSDISHPHTSGKKNGDQSATNSSWQRYHYTSPISDHQRPRSKQERICLYKQRTCRLLEGSCSPLI